MGSNLHFDITPHIVKQLGEQLVSDEVTALLELIKNSYDADASYVSIDINTQEKYTDEKLFYPDHKGYLIVEDDGFGMSRETILKSWLLISYSEKRNQKLKRKKTPKGRTPLGDKGLGRLSTQRLSDICEIFTSTDSKDGTHLAFNWKDFEKEDRLSEVRIKERNYNPKSIGTKLILSDLNYHEVWSGKNLERFKGQVSQIISPYKENRPFEVYIRVNGISIDLEESNENLRDLAFGRYKFNFDGSKISISGKTKLYKFLGNKPTEYKQYLLPDNGAKFFEFLSKKYPEYKKSNQNDFFLEFKQDHHLDDLGGMEVVDGERANPGPFQGVIDEFSYDNWLSKDEEVQNVFGGFANYRAFAQNQSGIKIYRNGFAVKPFGLDDNDWLKLGGGQTSGSSFYGLRPSNVIGYFSIDEGSNENLKDKTDREGLVSNPYSRNFFLIADFIKDRINIYQTNIRRAYNEFLNIYKTENSGIKTVSEAFNEIKRTKDETESLTKEAIQSKKTVDSLIEEQSRIVNEVENNPMFAKEEFKTNYDKALKILDRLKSIQKTFEGIEKIVQRSKNLGEVIDVLEPKIETLESQLSDFSELASLGITAESISHEFAGSADRLGLKANHYFKKLQNNSLSDSDLHVLLEYIKTTVNGFKVQLRHLDPALKYHREKKEKISISNFFQQEMNYYNHRFKEKEIQLDIKTTDDFRIKANRGKLTQIIDNLLINSEYWLKEKKSADANFQPRITIEIVSPWINIGDNGYGIPKSIENQLFDPFVTTKPKGKGRGLGLFIVRQLLDSMGGTIALDPERNNNGKLFNFTINLSNALI
ncbi:sensor histidine kinase [Salegentibacter sediminis]|uniref:sensor histidine kinase n=1 Tax=Salegentibacter sediminis TaxID=1930251 RepID=UPI0009BD4EDB|nr:sensor histidine kinase [Salegentibacter sediminis]